MWLIGKLPLKILYWISWSLSYIWWTLLPIRRQVAIDNLTLAFPDQDPRPLARRMMAELALSYLELNKYQHNPDAHTDMVSFTGLENLKPGSILLSGHGGAWDLCMLSISAQSKGTFSCIVREPSSPYARAYIKRARVAAGLGLLEPSGSMPAVYSTLKAGGVMIFVIDQRYNAGVQVPFFGKNALTTPALAAAARKTEAPVHLAWPRRVGLGRHTVNISEEIQHTWTQDRQADLLNATIKYNEAIEAQIRLAPHSWLWLHKRWRQP